MRLTILGSGTVSPHKTRVCAGHLVEAGDVRMLLDCGNGVVHRLATLDLAWNAITHVAITHFHYDHYGDLPALIAAFRWGQLPPRAEPLTILGPVGTMAFLEQFARTAGDWLLKPETFEVRVVEVAPGGDVALSGTKDVTLSAHPVPHTPESIAYSLSRAGARLVYTGDTGYDEAFADWAAECSVLLAECSLPAALAIPEHLTPETVGAIAARARPGRLVLTHMFPPVERENIRALIEARWSGPVVAADDGTVIEIED
ncbi:MAG TPA: ribonuclease Z [Gemmatimonadaceae bacterium]|nr:ribonuclease Z [Gemmatimonadaceae bacterium]